MLVGVFCNDHFALVAILFPGHPYIESATTLCDTVDFTYNTFFYQEVIKISQLISYYAVLIKQTNKNYIINLGHFLNLVVNQLCMFVCTTMLKVHVVRMY